MREILFRGKRVDNGEWIYGYYIKATHHWHNHGIHEYWIATDTVQNGGWCNVRGKYAVVPETVGQYTNLPDKHGNRIFEGDIVAVDQRIYERESHKYVVSFSEDRCGWFPFACGDGCGCCETDVEQNLSCEVIGNIHDNPELLK